MQKYSSNVATSSGSAIRGAQVYVFAEDGSIARIFSDRLGQLPIANPQATASDGTYSFYAANGRYSLQTTIEGVRYLSDDSVLLFDPADSPDGAGLPPVVTEAEAEDGTNALVRMFTPQRVWQATAKWWTGISSTVATAEQGEKADTALQSETDPTVPTWAKAASKPAYTKSEVGLGNVDNTSDVDKPVSTAQATAIAAKANSSVVLTAGTGLVGGGDLSGNRVLAADIASAVQIAAGTASKLVDAAGAKSQFLNPVAFSKADPYSVVFLKTGAGTVSIKAGTYVMVAGAMISFAAQTAVVMPALTLGTDYAIYACTDGSLRADASFTAPSGYTTANARQIGGFHYAPGGNATARAGGDAIPAINEYSLWDLKWRPACIDPRGMTLVANNFWADIYLTGVDHIANGTSKYNVAIARGTTPPKVPLEFGGNGSLAYGSMTWWEAAEVARAHGKQLPTYDQFGALAFGTTEQAASGGTDVPTTGQTGTGATTAWNALTSKWGVIQSTGCLWTWGREFAAAPGAAGPYNWFAETSGRGSILEFGAQSIVAALFGAGLDDGSHAGSRASLWSNAPSVSGGRVGLRCVVPHQVLV